MQTTQELEAKLNEQEDKINELTKKHEELLNKFNNLTFEYLNHKHTNVDGTQKVEGIEYPRMSFAKFGDSAITSYSASNGAQDTTMYLGTGRDAANFKNSSVDTELQLQNVGSTDLTTKNSFLFGVRTPILGNQTSVTSGGSTLTDTSFNWETDSLAGAWVNILDTNNILIESKQIASNTSSVITIHGTWGASTTGFYTVTMPVYLGSANYPWRQVYSVGENVAGSGASVKRRFFRIGHGATSGVNVIGMFYGQGTPEGSVTANIGSVYFRTDGGATTTLYVKTSGTSNTGWTPK